MEVPKYIAKKIQQQNKLYREILELEAQIDNWCDKSGIRTYEDVYNKKIKKVPTEEIHLFQEEELRKDDASGFSTDTKVESENEIVCKRCGKFILTEQKTSDGKIHCVKGSYENGYYDDSDNFYCLSCAKELGLE